MSYVSALMFFGGKRRSFETCLPDFTMVTMLWGIRQNGFFYLDRGVETLPNQHELINLQKTYYKL